MPILLVCAITRLGLVIAHMFDTLNYRINLNKSSYFTNEMRILTNGAMP